MALPTTTYLSFGVQIQNFQQNTLKKYKCVPFILPSWVSCESLVETNINFDFETNTYLSLKYFYPPRAKISEDTLVARCSFEVNLSRDWLVQFFQFQTSSVKID